MRPPQAPADLLRGPFTTSQALSAGLTRRQLQGAAWRQVFRGVHVAATQADSFALRVASARLLLPPNAAFSGTTAALLHDVDVRNRLDHPIEAVVPSGGVRPVSRPGLSVRTTQLADGDLEQMSGLRLTTAERTAWDLAGLGGPVEGVVAVDAFLQAGLCDLSALRALFGDRRSWRFGARALKALSRAAVGAESPMETRLRLVLVDAGLPGPVLQLEIRDGSGWFLGRVDLAYPEARLAIEYDGVQHADVLAWRADIRRQRAIEQEGWRILRFTATEVYRQPELIVAQVRAALDSRSVEKATSFRAG